MCRRVRGWVAVVAVVAAVALVGGACGDGGDGDGDGDGASGATTSTAAGSSGREGEIVAQVASYELLAGRKQRFLTGLVVSGKGTVVSFGSVALEFFYLGTKDAPIDPPQPKSSATAQFLPIAGQPAAVV